MQIIDLKRDPYGTLDKRGKPTIKTLGNVPKNPLQTMEDKLRIANKVNKKYKELMNELDETIKQATEDIGNDEAKALLENRPRNLTVEKCKNLQIMRFRSYVAVSNFPQVLVFFSRRGYCKPAEIERQVM